MLSSLFKIAENTCPWYTANFDSASGLVKALGNCLHGKSFPGVGSVPNSELFAKMINAIPWQLQRALYVKGSAKGAVDPQRLKEVDDEEFTRWVTGLFPKRKYPAILIGSSSGPAVHLGAAMGIPWLPQTFLIPVKTPGSLSVDEPVARMDWARQYAEKMLANNPALQLHHMMDPNQDRPMLRSTSYFRTKRLRLGTAYKQFITENLEEGGTLITVECQKSWPVTRVDERHYFQFGGLGGTTIEEYLNGSDNVKAFLKQAGSKSEKWNTPTINEVQPEAEWGFVSPLRDDVDRLAKENGYRTQRILFNEPEDFSPFVADLYRWWYALRNIPENRLIVGMFFLIEPYWTLRTGSVPFWLAFNARPSVDAIIEYLRKTKPYDEIFMMLFSHGVKGQGLATITDYRSALSMAQKKGEFIGAEPELYPFDFGVYARYEKDLQEQIKSRYPLGPRLTFQQLFQFIDETKGNYLVSWPATG